MTHILSEAVFFTVMGANDLLNNYFTLPVRRHQYDIPGYVDFLVSNAVNFILVNSYAIFHPYYFLSHFDYMEIKLPFISVLMYALQRLNIPYISVISRMCKNILISICF